MLRVEFCGEAHEVDEGGTFHIGREGDLVVDDNEYLHRRFLQLEHDGRLWWVTNVGTLLSATVSDAGGGVESYLSPGAGVPVVFPQTVVRFTAGTTTYEMVLELDGSDVSFTPSVVGASDQRDGDLTVRPPTLTLNQRLVVVALAEPALRGHGRGTGALPSSASAAARIGVSITTFNRRLDKVCDKLDAAGVRGLHGSSDGLASNRRARLVEYSLSTRLVTSADLDLLDGLHAQD